MELISMLLLAVVQGLTEFLPVSSSGHLALVQGWLRIPETVRLSVTVFLHLGTLLALMVYFRQELVLMGRGILRRDKEGGRLLGLVVAANGATVALALLLKPVVEQAFAAPRFVGVFLVATGALLFFSEEQSKRQRQQATLNGWRALVVGAAQGLAVLPGLSRSGATIAAGLCCGLAREQAGRFAFVVGIPAMVGANLLEAKGIATFPSFGWGELLLITLVAFGTGYLAIHWALKAVQRLQLRWFSLYCLGVALIAWLTG